VARWRRGHSGNQPYTQSAVMRSSIVAALGAQSILFISVGAIFFTGFWHCVGCRNTCRLAEMAYSPLLLLMFVGVIYLILGMFLDPLGLLLLTVPIFLPFFESAGYEKVWMGIMVVKFIEIGLITPPVGLNAFVVKGIVGDKISLGTIFRGLTWFIAAEIVIVVLLTAFPEIVMILPNRM